jgi:hypothetical protein
MVRVRQLRLRCRGTNARDGQDQGKKMARMFSSFANTIRPTAALGGRQLGCVLRVSPADGPDYQAGKRRAVSGVPSMFRVNFIFAEVLCTCNSNRELPCIAFTGPAS